MFEVAPFDRARVRVETMMDAGEPFAEVEQTIDHDPLSEDSRAALWLVAWSMNDRPRASRRRSVSQAAPLS